MKAKDRSQIWSGVGNGKALASPGDMPLSALVDVATIVSMADLAARTAGATVSVLAYNKAGPVPIVPDAPMLFAPGGGAESLKSHWQTAMAAMEEAKPVSSQSLSGCSVLHSSPVVLRYRNRNYPKAAITVENPRSEDALSTEGAEPKFAVEMVDHLAQTLSEHAVAAYSLYRANHRDAENTLREENRRLGLFLEHVGGALAVLDTNCCVVWTNEESKRPFGVYGEVVGKLCKDLVPAMGDRCKGCTVRRAFTSGQTESRVTGRIGPSGNPHFYHATAKPMRDSSGRIVHVMLLAQDVTELCRVERELQERTEMLEMQHRRLIEVARQKSQFFASVSHELRTPLTSIIGFTEILLEEADSHLDPARKGMLRKIGQNAERLLGMINDLLDLSKLESGRMTINLSRVSLPMLINEVIETMMPLVRDKEVELSAEVSPDLPPMRTDEQKVTQILINLISNAIKFTPKGSVTIRAEMKNGKASIAVSDTGIGIRRSDLGRIFEEFRQVGERRAGNGGTGLGLAITHKLVHLLGGEIHVSSKLGKGSTFTVTLPVLFSQSLTTRPAAMGA